MDEARPDESHEDLLLHLNFVPSWARRPPTEFGQRLDRPSREQDTRPLEPEDPPELGTRRPEGSGSGPRLRDREQGRFEPRRGSGGPRRGPSRPRESARAAAPAPRRERPPSGPRPMPAPPLSVAFLPERHRLGAVVHRIEASRRAYPLLQLAELFLSRPEFHVVRIEVVPSGSAETAGNAGADTPLPRLHQCTACGVVFTSAELAREHILGSHLDRWFDVREAAEEPPAGQFAFVARCPFTGRLIGPPNHHSFAEAVAEAYAEARSGISLADYRSRLEMVRDPAVIEQWRQDYARRRVYVRRDRPDAPPLSRTAARQALQTELVPRCVSASSRVIISGAVAEQVTDPAIRAVLRAAWNREQRFPATMMNALRPALRHMRLHMFKAAGHYTYVTAIHPAPMAPDHAIPPIREALSYLAAHPGVQRETMAADVLRDRAHDEAARAELFGHLSWLIEKGHVIEYFDGSLAVPSAPPTAHRLRDGATTPTEAEPSA